MVLHVAGRAVQAIHVVFSMVQSGPGRQNTAGTLSSERERVRERIYERERGKESEKL